MAAIEELKLDVAELQKLLSEATRSKVKDVLGLEIRKLQTDIINKEEKQRQAAENLARNGDGPTNSPVVRSDEGRIYTKEISTYAWDQSDKFMKIYVTLNGVKNIAEGNVTSQITDRSFKLHVKELEGKNYKCEVSHLFAEVDPSKSYHKIKTDMVLVMLKKVEEKKTWAYVTEKEQKMKDKKKPNVGAESGDPNDGMMNMLQQMYEDGDDEMKRTIAKSMYESRNKEGGMNLGGGGMGGMNL